MHHVLVARRLHVVAGRVLQRRLGLVLDGLLGDVGHALLGRHLAAGRGAVVVRCAPLQRARAGSTPAPQEGARCVQLIRRQAVTTISPRMPASAWPGTLHRNS